MSAADQQYAAGIGVSLPCGLPAGCAVAYCWVHECCQLETLALLTGERLSAFIDVTLAASAYTVADAARNGEVLPPVTREALVTLAAYLRENATEPERHEGDGYSHKLDMEIMERRGK